MEKGKAGFLTGCRSVPSGPDASSLNPFLCSRPHSAVLCPPPGPHHLSEDKRGASFGFSALALVSVAARRADGLSCLGPAPGRAATEGKTEDMEGPLHAGEQKWGLVLPPGGQAPLSALLPAWHLARRWTGGKRRVQVTPFRWWLLSGLCPPALTGRVLAPSAPRKGGPRTATRKARYLGRRPGARGRLRLRDCGPPRPCLAPAAPAEP